MKKIYIILLLTFTSHLMNAQKFTQMFAETKGTETKLMWFIYQWNPQATGIIIKKRILYHGKDQQWVDSKSTEIKPSFGVERDLSLQVTYDGIVEILKLKQLQLIQMSKYKTLDNSAYVKKMVSDSGAMLGLSILFFNDYNLALLNGFALQDTNENAIDSVEYSINFNHTASNIPLAIVKIKNGVNSIKDFNYQLKFKPNNQKDAVNIIWNFSNEDAVSSGFHGFNIYKKSKDSKWVKLTQTPIWFQTLTKSTYFLDNYIRKDSSYVYSLVPISIFGTEGNKVEHIYDSKLYAGTITAPEIFENKKSTNAQQLSIGWKLIEKQNKFIKGYIIQRKSHIDSTYQDIGKILGNNIKQYDDNNNLNYGQYYFYRLKVEPDAFQEMESVYSKELLIYYKPQLFPSIPKGLTGEFKIVENKRYIHIRWARNSDKYTAGYHIYVNFPPDTQLNWQSDLGTIKENEFMFPVNNYEYATYCFAITSVSAFDDESIKSETLKVVSPSALLNIVQIWPFQVDSNQITLNWKYIDTKDLKGFRIYQDGKLIADENTVTKNIRKYIIYSLNYSNQYIYEMEAISESGLKSKMSNPIKIRIDKPRKK